MRIIYMDQWSVPIVKKNPQLLFVFRDNDKGIGKKGQAIIRGQPNAIGIPTKKTPRSYSSAFYTDEEYDSNCVTIQEAIHRIHAILLSKECPYEGLVLSSGGLGTGLAQLDHRAPRTYQFLVETIDSFMIQIHPLYA